MKDGHRKPQKENGGHRQQVPKAAQKKHTQGRMAPEKDNEYDETQHVIDDGAVSNKHSCGSLIDNATTMHGYLPLYELEMR